ncbi:hypothetical protein EVAR_73399_1 [Eumeta japonica]|uniref:Uncharacterized protein n=1 Tax=Eumeta variegata TaxID=151549 RepID=A0A4C1SEU8_EUMVA|nr:hypothetical protein EVAR_73399_1 [Eumeta japonica]
MYKHDTRNNQLVRTIRKHSVRSAAALRNNRCHDQLHAVTGSAACCCAEPQVVAPPAIYLSGFSIYKMTVVTALVTVLGNSSRLRLVYMARCPRPTIWSKSIE